jgi:hypothetical protein
MAVIVTVHTPAGMSNVVTPGVSNTAGSAPATDDAVNPTKAPPAAKATADATPKNRRCTVPMSLPLPWGKAARALAASASCHHDRAGNAPADSSGHLR